LALGVRATCAASSDIRALETRMSDERLNDADQILRAPANALLPSSREASQRELIRELKRERASERCAAGRWAAGWSATGRGRRSGSVGLPVAQTSSSYVRTARAKPTRLGAHGSHALRSLRVSSCPTRLAP